jgi:hypothetical protein
MAAYMIPILLCVVLLFGGVVAFMFYKLLRSAPLPHTSAESSADEPGAALKERSSDP